MFQFDSFTDRRPFGAVQKGTAVTLTAQADGAVTQATLVIMPDEHCDQTQSLADDEKP